MTKIIKEYYLGFSNFTNPMIACYIPLNIYRYYIDIIYMAKFYTSYVNQLTS